LSDAYFTPGAPSRRIALQPVADVLTQQNDYDVCDDAIASSLLSVLVLMPSANQKVPSCFDSL
jgi:hypothetical protein